MTGQGEKMTASADAPDGEFIVRVCQGDLEALGELYDRYRTQVFWTALAITHNRETAEDILQEVFLKLHRYAERIDTSVSLGPWLYRVTANLCYTYLSRQKRWLSALEDVFENVVAPPTRASPERRYERGELHDVLQQAIDQLSPNQKIVIVLHYLTDLSIKEIAEIVEVPEGTVKSRLYYGRENLRRKLSSSRVLFPEVTYEFT
jgi:RNA polymerase sigma-70 factor (ECF subfamily)